MLTVSVGGELCTSTGAGHDPFDDAGAASHSLSSFAPFDLLSMLPGRLERLDALRSYTHTYLCSVDGDDRRTSSRRAGWV